MCENNMIVGLLKLQRQFMKKCVGHISGMDITIG